MNNDFNMTKASPVAGPVKVGKRVILKFEDTGLDFYRYEVLGVGQGGGVELLALDFPHFSRVIRTEALQVGLRHMAAYQKGLSAVSSCIVENFINIDRYYLS